MLQLPGDQLRERIAALDRTDAQYATSVIELLLAASRAADASDLHLTPTSTGMDVRWRLDGVLHPVVALPDAVAANVIARLKVLAGLLTYETDRPQEGRIAPQAGDVEMRLSTFPTLYGEKAVVRLFSSRGAYCRLKDLGLPGDVEASLAQSLSATSGAIVVTGPAGSGKTTTVYACLREIAHAAQGSRSLASLEDPIEVAVGGVAQSQVDPRAGLDMATGLRFMMRQDPQVIMLGEIRDRATAEAALGASLTGHLVLSTFHAGSAGSALSRLSDMGIEPYVLRSGILAVVHQRLVRRLCACSQPANDAADLLGLDVQAARVAVGCPECRQTGYRGRMLLAEMLRAEAGQLGHAILSRRDAASLQRLAVEAGMVPAWQRAREAVEAGRTSPAEIRRVIGFADIVHNDDG